MPEYFMGQELIQGELPVNSPRPPETPPEGVIMTDTRPDGSSRRYIYIAMAGEAPEEITISETGSRRISGVASPVFDEEPAPLPMMGVSIPEGIDLPPNAVLPENAVFSGVPNPNAECRRPVVAPAATTRQPLTMGAAVRHGTAPLTIPLPAAASAPVATVGLQKAGPPAAIMVQQAQAPLPGGQVHVPAVQSPVHDVREMSGNIRLSNSIDTVRPVVATSIADVGPMAPALGHSRSLPLTVHEGRKSDTYPVSNPVNQNAPMAAGIGPIGGPSAFVQNQVPLRHLGQAAPAAPPPPPPMPAPGSINKCPGAVEMPDGRVIEPGDTINLQDLCELVPFLVETLTQALAPGRVPVIGQRPGALPATPSFGPAGGFVGGGGGGPGPTGPPGPAGAAGPPGPGSIVEPPVVKTDGDFTAGPGAFVPVPGTSLVWSMLASGIAKFDLLATLGNTSGIVGTSQSAQLGLRVDGTDYPLTTRLIHTFIGGVGEFMVGQSSTFSLSLGPGSHTVEVLLRGLLPGEYGGAGLGVPATVAAVPTVPLILTVSHSQ